jgi:uncharacterized protein Usg
LYLGDFPEARDRRLPAAGQPGSARPRLFPAVRMLQGDKGARDLIAAAQENSLELTAGDSRLKSISIQGRICACFAAFDRHETKRQRWRIFFPAHGSHKFRAQLRINVTPVEWTQQKNGSQQYVGAGQNRTSSSTVLRTRSGWYTGTEVKAMTATKTIATNKASSDFIKQLAGYGLATARILYHLPDHPRLLQTYIWQDYDLAPDFPILIKFLAFWREKLDGPLHSVVVGHSKLIKPAEIKTLDGEFWLH